MVKSTLKDKLTLFLVIICLLSVIISYTLSVNAQDVVKPSVLIKNKDQLLDNGFNKTINKTIFPYSEQGLTDFYMPITFKKSDIGVLSKLDIGYSILNSNKNFTDRFISLDYEVFESDTHYMVYYHMKVKASTKNFSIDLIPKIKNVDYNKYAWWNSNWLNNIVFTLDSSFVDSDLTWFPLQIYVNNATIMSLLQGANGEDIRFVNSANTTEYYFEIERLTASEMIAWVNVTRIESGVDTIINWYFNNSVASNSSYRNAGVTWRSEYIFVSHCNESSGSNLIDISGNNNDLTVNNSGTRVEAKIGYGQDLTNDWWSRNGFLDNWPSELSFNIWFNRDTSGATQYLFSKHNVWAQDRAYLLTIFSNNTLRTTQETQNSNTRHTYYSNGISNNIWYRSGFLYKDSDDQDLIVNATIIDHGLGTNVLQNGGKEYFYLCQASSNNSLDGTIDEVRISEKKWNASWVKADFHSQNRSNTFLTSSIVHDVVLTCAPVISQQNPVNNSYENDPIGISINVLINHSGVCAWDYVNISLYNGSYLFYNNQTTSLGNNTYYLNNTNITYEEEYRYYVNVSAGNQTHRWYNFTTLNMSMMILYNEVLMDLEGDDDVNIGLTDSFLWIIVWFILMLGVIRFKDSILVSIMSMILPVWSFYMYNNNLFPIYSFMLLFISIVFTFVGIYRILNMNSKNKRIVSTSKRKTYGRKRKGIY